MTAADPGTQGPTGAPESDPRTTRERILEIALEHFRAHGYGRTTLREIAEPLGMTKAALYYHFKAKADLLEALARPFLEGFETMVAAAEQAGAAFDAAALVERGLDAMLEDRRVVSWLLRDFSALEHPDIGPRLLSVQDRLRVLLMGGDGSPEAAARVACAMGALFWPMVTLRDTELAAARDAILQTVRRILDSPVARR